MDSLSGLKNVCCLLIAFDGLATETAFRCSNRIACIQGSSNTVVMIECNHAAKNMRCQFVLGSTIVTGSNVLFDVSILRIAGISPELRIQVK